MAAFTRGRKLEDLSVQSAMAHMVFSVRTTDSVDAALRRMTEHAVRRLPAVDEHARIAGIVSFADLCQAKSGVAAAAIAQAAATLTAPRGASTNAQKKAVDVAVSAPVPAAPVSPAPAPVASAAPAPAPQKAPVPAADASAKKTKGRRI
jgi:CBS-domain-containing membrane protein